MPVPGSDSCHLQDPSKSDNNDSETRLAPDRAVKNRIATFGPYLGLPRPPLEPPIAKASVLDVFASSLVPADEGPELGRPLTKAPKRIVEEVNAAAMTSLDDTAWAICNVEGSAPFPSASPLPHGGDSAGACRQIPGRPWGCG